MEGVYGELIGDKSVGELGGYIGHAMPEGSPEDVAGDDAAAVAAYIHDAFYSPLAQERLRPARVQAARLTARQFENALADLFDDVSYLFTEIDPWAASPPKPDKLGAEWTIVDGNDWKSKQVVSRDAVDLSFGPDGPTLPEGVKPLTDDTSKMYFKFGLIAPETGNYELKIDANVSYVLYFNHDEVINSHTVSLDAGDWTRSIRVRLLAGRPYMFDLHTNVPILKNRKKGEKQPVHSETSSGDLTQFHLKALWTPPGGVEELIPKQAMFNNWSPATFVSRTGMPADDRSTGYVRAGDISEDWWNNVARMALEAGDFAAAHVHDYTGTRPKNFADEADEKKRGQMLERVSKWVVQMTRRGWRTDLSEEEAALRERFAAEVAADGMEEAVRRHVLRVVLSPRFLYREVNFGQMDSHAIASWLSFTLYDSLPTNGMLDMAKRNDFRKDGTLDWFVPQMMADVRAKAKLRAFAHSWLHVDQFGDLSKNAERFPEFTPELEHDLRRSLDYFLADALWGEQSSFKRLMTSTELWVSPTLADVYGGQAERGDDDAWSKIWMGEQKRAGLLTHPYLMAGFSYDEETSPIHRGVFLSRSILGRLLKPPPIAVAPLAPELQPELTQRQRVAVQTQAVSCQSCHSMINPLGFSLEHFDALGRRREQAQGKPVDASGQYVTKSGEEVAFADVTELAAWIAESREAQEAFVEQLFQSLVNQPVQAFGPETLDTLTDRFAAEGFNVSKLAAACAKLSTERSRELFDRSQEVATK